MGQLKIVLTLFAFCIRLLCVGQSNGNCDTAIELEFEDFVSYDFESMNSDRELGCFQFPINKHWFSIMGDGRVIKFDYSLSIGAPHYFILSGNCDSLVCVQNRSYEGPVYFETEANVSYKIVFAGNKIFSNPEDEPGGQFSIKIESFEADCVDSLNHITVVGNNAFLSAIDYINGCPVLTGSATFISGGTINLGGGFEVTNNAVFECIIDDCSEN